VIIVANGGASLLILLMRLMPRIATGTLSLFSDVAVTIQGVINSASEYEEERA
jgi:hypothetical protein